MPLCFLASDLHGHADRYDKLFASIAERRPAAVFLAGDLLPAAWAAAAGGVDVLHDVVLDGLRQLRRSLGEAYPRLFVILGNDDPRCLEPIMMDAEREGLWDYAHQRRLSWANRAVYGYACVPPTPFGLKDWERYDVSRYVDPGCVSPEEGRRTVAMSDHDKRYRTIAADLDALVGEADLSDAMLLLHTPPYQGHLDRAALDGKTVEHVPLDVHVGSIALQRFIEQRQPLVTLHGHVHESARLTGQWRDRIGRTHCFSAAHDGDELALVVFDLTDLDTAERRLL